MYLLSIRAAFDQTRNNRCTTGLNVFWTSLKTLQTWRRG